MRNAAQHARNGRRAFARKDDKGPELRSQWEWDKWMNGWHAECSSWVLQTGAMAQDVADRGPYCILPTNREGVVMYGARAGKGDAA